MINKLISITLVALLLLVCCSSNDNPSPVKPEPVDSTTFLFGADLSYVNQILEKGGAYRRNGNIEDPYQIFAAAGANLSRFRLWHNPTWTKTVYGEAGERLYNDLTDVEQSIKHARQNGMRILLDFHYSDTWADPGHQPIPAAWMGITSISVLKDSVYNYTHKTLSYLNSKGLMPEYVQIGNETNCGMLYSEAPQGFPAGNGCDGKWINLGHVINSAIDAVRAVSEESTIKTKIALHVADPKNVDWFFSNLSATAQVTDFDIIGFSFYPLWHTTFSVNDISEKITEFRTKFDKDVMVLETAYPWTTASADNYNNLLGGAPLPNYPFTEEGQYNFLVKLTQEIKRGQGIGLIYWEPAWITSNMKDLWGTGSAWENATFFDFEGNAIKGIDYMNFDY
jgi:arabinogalactan endo-1,4-beta-galactosidase